MGEQVDYYMHINKSPYGPKFEKEVKDSNSDISNILSNVNINPQREQRWGDWKTFLNSDLPSSQAPSVKKTKKTGGLLDTMVGNSNVLSEGLNDISKVLKDGQEVQKKLSASLDGVGSNLSASLQLISSVLVAGNALKKVGDKVNSFHSDIQSRKNIMAMDQMEFESNKYSGLVDMHGQPLEISPREAKVRKNIESYKNQNFQNHGVENFDDTEGNQIVPSKAKASKDAEKAIDERKMNQFDHGSLLGEVSNESEKLFDEGGNIFDKALAHYKNMDIDRLDGLVKNDEEFNHG